MSVAAGNYVAAGMNEMWLTAENDAAVHHRNGRELSKRDESDFTAIQHGTESRNSATAVHRLLRRVVKRVELAVRLAFVCGLVVASQGQDILLTREFDSGAEHTSRISLDATGMYLVGYRGLPYAITGLFIRKTDFAGAELWTRQ